MRSDNDEMEEDTIANSEMAKFGSELKQQQKNERWENGLQLSLEEGEADFTWRLHVELSFKYYGLNYIFLRNSLGKFLRKLICHI